MRETVARTWRVYRWAVYPCVMLGLLLLLFGPPNDNDATTGAIEFFGIATVVVLMMWLSPTLTFRSIPQDNKTTWSIRADQIEIASAASDTRLQWRGLLRVQETRAAFLFYTQPFIFYIVPKRVLSIDDVQAVRRLSRDALGPRAKVSAVLQ